MTEEQPVWMVTRTANQQLFDNFGRTVAGKRVFYTIVDGHQDYVDIPLSDYNAQTVLDAIHTAVLKHFQIKSLAGPPSGTDMPMTAPTIPNVIR